MNAFLAMPLLLLSTAATAQAIQPGNWDVTSTAVDLDIPGAPHFLLRMLRGRSRVEHKCVAPDQAKLGVAALLAPDPKAKCHVESLTASDGRFEQVLACPQKEGAPLRILRGGSYSAAGYSARMIMTGQSKKGAMRVVIDQKAAFTGAMCRK